MRKKMKLVVGIICTLIVGCIGGVGYLLYDAQQQMNESVEVITQLEQEVALANERAEQAALDAKKAKKKTVTAQKEIQEYKEKLDQMEELNRETSISEVTATLEPTVVETSVPDPDIIGAWIDTWSGRTKMIITAREGEPGLEIVIDASSGAVDGTQWNLFSEAYDPSISGFNYYGSRYYYAYEEGASYATFTKKSSDEAGILRYNNDRLYWEDYRGNIATQNLEFVRR